MPITFPSCFSTPGVRGFGDLGLIDDGELAGMQVCEVVRSGFKEYCSAPCFGWLGTKNGKSGDNKNVRSGFLALYFFHPPNEPEKLGVAGVWAPDRDEILSNQGKWLHRCGVTRVPEGPGQWVDDFWTEWSFFAQFEPNVRVVADDTFMTSDPDDFCLRGVLHEENYKPVFTASNQAWTIKNVLGLLSDKNREKVRPIAPAPPSGLVSDVAAFDEIPRSIAWVGDRLIAGGLKAGEPCEIVSVERDGETVMGVLLGAPARDGSGRIRLVRRVADLDLADVDAAWQQEPSAAALMLEETSVDVTACSKLLLVPNGATHAFGLEYSAILNLRLVETADGLEAVHEKVTRRGACQQVAAWTKQRGGIDGARTILTVANEIRLQGIPEKQDNLARSLITLRATSLASAVAVAPALEWRGDRALTLEQPLTRADLERICTLNAALGWRVADPEPTRSGAQRKRKRNKGFILVEPAETNRAVYCMETKVLQLELALALFGENLEFVRGLDPGDGIHPLAMPQYDIVTRTHRAATSVPARTLARADTHFAIVCDQ